MNFNKIIWMAFTLTNAIFWVGFFGYLFLHPNGGLMLVERSRIISGIEFCVAVYSFILCFVFFGRIK